VSVWTALPTGQDVPIAAGGWYAAVASIDDPAATQDSITKAMAKFYPGMTLASFGSQGDAGYSAIGTDPDTSRKRVALVVHSTGEAAYSGTLPWSRGVFVVRPHIYTLVAAWSGGTGAEPSGPLPWGSTPGSSSSSSSSSSSRPNLALWGVAGLAGIAAIWTGYAYRRELADAWQRLTAPRSLAP
jgi:hypothetical protein